MKNIFAIVFSLISTYSFSQQPFELKQSYLVSKTGDTLLVNIKAIKDNKIIYTKINDSYEYRVNTDALSSWKWEEWWLIELPKNDNNEVEIVSVIQVPGVDKNELYNRAKLWFVNTFKDARSVLELDDREGGILQGTGYYSMNSRIGKLWSTTQIEIKEGRFRYTLKNLEIRTDPSYVSSIHVPGTTTTLSELYSDKNIIERDKLVRTEIVTFINSHIKSLINRMTEQTSPGKDW